MDKHTLKLVYTLTLLGCSKQELANYFEVSRDTIHEWSRRYPEFSDALERGGIQADARVAKSLFKRATGFCQVEEKIINVSGSVSHTTDTCAVIANTKKNTVLKIRTRKRYPPDTQAIIFWLSNRRPALWTNKNSPNVTPPPLPQTVTVNVITDEETKQKLLDAERQARKLAITRY